MGFIFELNFSKFMYSWITSKVTAQGPIFQNLWQARVPYQSFDFPETKKIFAFVNCKGSSIYLNHKSAVECWFFLKKKRDSKTLYLNEQNKRKTC